jgi:transcriptional regulator with XRE-family HTH domain
MVISMIGMRIKEIRKELGLSQGELAKSITVSAKQVGFWERGEARPSEIYLQKISFIFAVSLDWLKTGRGEKYQIPPSERNPGAAIDFLKNHEELMHQRPGLYYLLTDASKDRLLIREEEAEYLAQTDLPGHERADYLTELGRYRERRHLPDFHLAPEEKKLIASLRAMAPEDKREVMEFLEFKAGRKKRE